MSQDGGPAFPRRGQVEYDDRPQTGMSLRDWFAGQALVGLLSHPATQAVQSAHEAAYIVADRMLKERSKND